jgi:hypothetical protein
MYESDCVTRSSCTIINPPINQRLNESSTTIAKDQKEERRRTKNEKEVRYVGGLVVGEEDDLVVGEVEAPHGLALGWQVVHHVVGPLQDLLPLLVV